MKKVYVVMCLLGSMTYLSAQTTIKTYLGQPVDFRVYKGVKVIGFDNPIKTRAVLEAVEKDQVLESYPTFPTSLFLPNTQEKATQIQQIRQANWPTVGGVKVRDQESLVTKDVLNAVTQLFPNSLVGGLDYVILHYDSLKAVWASAIPSIGRVPRLKRIVVVDEKMASTNESRANYKAGWEVHNTTDFSYWANDILVGKDEVAVRGDIPYDIDSRWTLTMGWITTLANGGLSYGLDDPINKCRIDYGVLHELSHHLPVGDYYVYAPGGGQVNVPNAAFNNTIPYSTSFAGHFLNDEHMCNASGRKLTSFSSYAIKLWHKLNPINERNSQKFEAPGPTQEVYGQFYSSQCTIKIENLQGLGLENVYLMKENGNNLEVSSDYTSQSFVNNTYTLVLSPSQQENLYPSFHIALQKNGVILPIMIPRVLVESIIYKGMLAGQSASTPIEIKIDIKSYASNVLTKLQQLFNQTVPDAGTTGFKMIAYNTSKPTPANIFAEMTVDDLGNRYAVAFDGADAAVNTPPTVVITSPAANSTIEATSIDITATASDNGSVAKVEFIVGSSTIVGTDFTAPYSVTVNLSPGTYVITAKATDNEGAVSYYSIPRVTIVAPTNPVSGPNCGSINSSIAFELNASKRTNATNYQWWYNGSVQSITPVAGSPYKVNILTGAFFNAGEVCVGVNYSASPWYASYCKTIAKCVSARMADGETASGTEDESMMESAISPNPTVDQFNLNIASDVSSISVANEIGQIVYQHSNVSAGEKLSLGDDFVSGIYLLSIQYVSGTIEKKRIVKMK